MYSEIILNRTMHDLCNLGNLLRYFEYMNFEVFIFLNYLRN